MFPKRATARHKPARIQRQYPWIFSRANVVINLRERNHIGAPFSQIKRLIFLDFELFMVITFCGSQASTDAVPNAVVFWHQAG